VGACDGKEEIDGVTDGLSEGHSEGLYEGAWDMDGLIEGLAGASSGITELATVGNDDAISVGSVCPDVISQIVARQR
jgi:hypothetical protein